MCDDETDDVNVEDGDVEDVDVIGIPAVFAVAACVPDAVVVTVAVLEEDSDDNDDDDVFMRAAGMDTRGEAARDRAGDTGSSRTRSPRVSSATE
jgi:hypothetical protein